ncbi:MAG: undecaprenyl-diphosphate phosphatase [Lentisphaeraceae bacterium]|nr:undecaprenyl-diphosphate phosphatase [Lentisphaeraceae bacterium]
MSELIKAFFLGVIQGFAEFLPISSSGHLVIFSKIFSYENAGLMMNTFVHFGTLMAIFIVFRKDIKEMLLSLPQVFSFISTGAKVEKEEDKPIALAFFVVLGSIPAAVIGLLFKHHFEKMHDVLAPTCLALIFTACFLWSSKFAKENTNLYFMTGLQAFIIGMAQAFAIIPGISRSGATIVLALWLGLTKDLSARYSFLLSIPVVLGASLLEMYGAFKNSGAIFSGDQWLELLVGTVAAAVSGYIAIKWMLKLLKNDKFSYFAVYCAVMGVGILVLNWLKPEWFI